MEGALLGYRLCKVGMLYAWLVCSVHGWHALCMVGMLCVWLVCSVHGWYALCMVCMLCLWSLIVYRSSKKMHVLQCTCTCIVPWDYKIPREAVSFLFGTKIFTPNLAYEVITGSSVTIVTQRSS